MPYIDSARLLASNDVLVAGSRFRFEKWPFEREKERSPILRPDPAGPTQDGGSPKPSAKRLSALAMEAGVGLPGRPPQNHANSESEAPSSSTSQPTEPQTPAKGEAPAAINAKHGPAAASLPSNPVLPSPPQQHRQPPQAPQLAAYNSSNKTALPPSVQPATPTQSPALPVNCLVKPQFSMAPTRTVPAKRASDALASLPTPPAVNASAPVVPASLRKFIDFRGGESQTAKAPAVINESQRAKPQPKKRRYKYSIMD